MYLRNISSNTQLSDLKSHNKASIPPSINAYSGRLDQFVADLENFFPNKPDELHAYAKNNRDTLKATLNNSKILRAYLGIKNPNSISSNVSIIPDSEAVQSWAQAATLLNEPREQNLCLKRLHDVLLEQQENGTARGAKNQVAAACACRELLQNFSELKNDVLKDNVMKIVSGHMAFLTEIQKSDLCAVAKKNAISIQVQSKLQPPSSLKEWNTLDNERRRPVEGKLEQTMFDISHKASSYAAVVGSGARNNFLPQAAVSAIYVSDETASESYHRRDPELNKLPVFFSSFEETEVFGEQGHLLGTIERTAKGEAISETAKHSTPARSKTGEKDPPLSTQDKQEREIRAQAATAIFDRYSGKYAEKLHNHVLGELRELIKSGKMDPSLNKITVNIVRPEREMYLDDFKIDFLSLMAQTELTEILNGIEARRLKNGTKDNHTDLPKIEFKDLKNCISLHRTDNSSTSRLGNIAEDGYFDASQIEEDDIAIITDDRTTSGGTILSMAAALKGAGAHVLGAAVPAAHPLCFQLGLSQDAARLLDSTVQSWDKKGAVKAQLAKIGKSFDTLTNQEALTLIAYAVDPENEEALEQFREVEDRLNVQAQLKKAGIPLERLTDQDINNLIDKARKPGDLEALKLAKSTEDKLDTLKADLKIHGELLGDQGIQGVLDKEGSLDGILQQKQWTPAQVVQELEKVRASRKIVEPVPINEVHISDWDAYLRERKNLNYKLFYNTLAVCSDERFGTYRPLIKKIFEVADSMRKKLEATPAEEREHRDDMPEVFREMGDFYDFAMQDDFGCRKMVTDLVDNLSGADDAFKDVFSSEMSEAEKKEKIGQFLDREVPGIDEALKIKIIEASDLERWRMVSDLANGPGMDKNLGEKLAQEIKSEKQEIVNILQAEFTRQYKKLIESDIDRNGLASDEVKSETGKGRSTHRVPEEKLPIDKISEKAIKAGKENLRSTASELVKFRMRRTVEPLKKDLPFPDVELEFMKGAREFLQSLMKADIRRILNSNSEHTDIRKELNKMNAMDMFDRFTGTPEGAVVGKDGVEKIGRLHEKPDPERSMRELEHLPGAQNARRFTGGDRVKDMTQFAGEEGMEGILVNEPRGFTSGELKSIPFPTTPFSSLYDVISHLDALRKSSTVA
jgi:hypothetical protein